MNAPQRREAYGSRQKTLGVGDRLGVVRCNHCKVLVASEHRAAHALECRQKRNKEKLKAVNLEKDGHYMYAVVVSRRTGKDSWSEPEINYVHAPNAKLAKAFFLTGENLNNLVVLEAGLAIGWFQDQNGNISG
jgi:hypothetical protein